MSKKLNRREFVQTTTAASVAAATAPLSVRPTWDASLARRYRRKPLAGLRDRGDLASALARGGYRVSRRACQ